ncbi:phosphotransferase family protein [Halosimplex aquaticum]|uniref:Phosphotransferase family protein n=1 Tax=Halosimplex aquaticum TaxID=3026162 RepID=A0ABD5XZU5_9EURY|nr:phosphotransferase [Halosimplex aquaticum]
MSDRTIPDAQITELVERVEPTWRVEDATPAEDGHHVVYFLDVATPEGTREVVLKGTPSGQSSSCDDEARLLAVLDDHTDLPVPEVLGAVDDADGLPTPAFLATALPGGNYSRTALVEFSTERVRELARSTGRLLAELHRLDAVDAYGFVGVAADERLDGGRPSADLDQIVVHDPTESWTDYLRGEVERLDDHLADTRFADLRRTVLSAVGARIDDLAGEFDPVLARVDQSLDNSLVDPDTGRVTGLLDWEFCVAATPAYDLAFVEYTLVGGHWRLLPEGPDHRAAIREALVEGYGAAGPDHVVEQFRANRECYAPLVRAHEMANFAAWFDGVGADFDHRRDEAARRLRAEIDRIA